MTHKRNLRNLRSLFSNYQSIFYFANFPDFDTLHFSNFLKRSGINLNVDKILNIAKTVTMLKIKLPTIDEKIQSELRISEIPLCVRNDGIHFGGGSGGEVAPTPLKNKDLSFRAKRGIPLKNANADYGFKTVSNISAKTFKTPNRDVTVQYHFPKIRLTSPIR